MVNQSDLLRYTDASTDPAFLHTLIRIFQHRHQTLFAKVLPTEVSGLQTTAYKTATEVQGRSGLAHLHAVLWRPVSSDVSSVMERCQARQSGGLSREDFQGVVDLATSILTVTLSPGVLHAQFPALSPILSIKAVGLARKFQVHTCTEFCTSSSPEDQLCKEWFPRLPSVFALVARTPLADCKNDAAMLEKFERIHLQVQRLLRDAQARVYLHPPGTDLDALVALLGMVSVNDQPLRLEDGGYTWAGTTFPNGPQLTRLINDCRALEVDENGAVILALYHYTLMLRYYSKFIPIRTVHEVWIASYNPIVLLAWQANMELELVLHTPEKLFRYVAKGTGQRSLNAAISELGKRGEKGDEKAAQRLEEAVEAGKCEVPMTEALIRLDSKLSLTTSFPTKVTWVNTSLGDQGPGSVQRSRGCQH